MLSPRKGKAVFFPAVGPDRDSSTALPETTLHRPVSTVRRDQGGILPWGVSSHRKDSSGRKETQKTNFVGALASSTMKPLSFKRQRVL